MLIAHAAIELLKKETPEFIPPSLRPPNLQIESDYRVWVICKRGVQYSHHWSGPIDDATDEWLSQWWCEPVWPAPFLLAVSFHPFTVSVPGLLLTVHDLSLKLTLFVHLWRSCFSVELMQHYHSSSVTVFAAGTMSNGHI